MGSRRWPRTILCRTVLVTALAGACVLPSCRVSSAITTTVAEGVMTALQLCNDVLETSISALSDDLESKTLAWGKAVGAVKAAEYELKLASYYRFALSQDDKATIAAKLLETIALMTELEALAADTVGTTYIKKELPKMRDYVRQFS